jgi:hypothetical protein
MIGIRPSTRRLRMKAGLPAPRRAGHKPTIDELVVRKEIQSSKASGA